MDAFFENVVHHADRGVCGDRCCLYPGLLVAIATGVVAYFSYMNADIEYEYLYLDKEISVDKVMAKSRRKKMGSYNLEQMEIFAPLNSHRLDSYKNRQMKTLDYSSGVAAQRKSVT